MLKKTGTLIIDIEAKGTVDSKIIDALRSKKDVADLITGDEKREVVGMSEIIELPDDSPMWLINEQIVGLLEGEGAEEDHASVLQFLHGTGLPASTVLRIHAVICNGEGRFK